MNRYLVPVSLALGATLLLGLGVSPAIADITQTDNLTLKTGDTPKLRLEQTNTGGFTPQTWDVAGNEANFFVRDITGGSKLPFRIRPGAPTSSIDIAANGNVGIGTASPGGPLNIARAGAVSLIYTDLTPGVSWASGIPGGGGSFTIGVNGASPVMTLRSFGDLDLTGSLSEAASAATVAEVQSIDPAAILSKLAGLPIQSWRFNGAPTNARHLGPLGGSFAAAFGLGGDPNRIAPGDVAGVALAAAQGLIATSASLEAKAQSAAKANRKLSKRVGKLAKQLKSLRKAVSKLAE